MLVGLGVLRSTEGHERRGRNKIKGGREGRKEGRLAGRVSMICVSVKESVGGKE